VRWAILVKVASYLNFGTLLDPISTSMDGNTST